MQELLIKFTDQSESFTNGVEFGKLLFMMQLNLYRVANDGFPIHTDNIDVLKEACNIYGYVPYFNECEVPGWTYFFAVKNLASGN